MGTDERPPDAEGGDAESKEVARPDEPEVVESFPVAGQVIQRLSVRQAPYPTPDELREYESIHPGFTNRILTLTERETDHRIHREQTQDAATISLARRGQTYAFVVVMTLVLGSVAAILTDHSIVGLAALVVAAATLAGAFFAPRVLASRQERLEDEVPEGTDRDQRATETSET